MAGRHASETLKPATFRWLGHSLKAVAIGEWRAIGACGLRRRAAGSAWKILGFCVSKCAREVLAFTQIS